MKDLNLDLNSQAYLEELLRLEFPEAKVNNIVPFYVNSTPKELHKSGVVYYGYYRGETPAKHQGRTVDVGDIPVLVDTIPVDGTLTGFQVTMEGYVESGLNQVPTPPLPDPVSQISVTQYLAITDVGKTWITLKAVITTANVRFIDNLGNVMPVQLSYPIVNGYSKFRLTGTNISRFEIFGVNGVYSNVSVSKVAPMTTYMTGNILNVVNDTMFSDVFGISFDNNVANPIATKFLNVGDVWQFDLINYNYSTVQLGLYGMQVSIDLPKPPVSLQYLYPFIAPNSAGGLPQTGLFVVLSNVTGSGKIGYKANNDSAIIPMVYDTTKGYYKIDNYTGLGTANGQFNTSYQIGLIDSANNFIGTPLTFATDRNGWVFPILLPNAPLSQPQQLLFKNSPNYNYEATIHEYTQYYNGGTLIKSWSMIEPISDDLELLDNQTRGLVMQLVITTPDGNKSLPNLLTYHTSNV